LTEGFTEVFNVEFEEGALTDFEKEHLNQRLSFYNSEDWIYGLRRPLKNRKELRAVHKTEGGLIRASVVADPKTKRIHSVLITGDFFAYPKRTILDLEARLKDTPSENSILESTIEDFFLEKEPEIPGVKPEDFINVINKALEKLNYGDFGIPLEDSNRIFTVNSSLADMPKCSVLLLPYCAKKIDCEYRKKKDCIICDECNVGESYGFAQDNGIEVVTILDFEDLLGTLTRYKDSGVLAFVGSCCEAFYVKHLEDFERIGLPGVLVDIDNKTCYELGFEEEALVGEFEKRTELRTDLIEKVLKRMCLN
jgi:lipoate-protein ligase A